MTDNHATEHFAVTYTLSRADYSAGLRLGMSLSAGIVFVLFAMVLGFFVWLYSLLAAWIARPGRGVIGEHTITLTEDGLTESTVVNRSEHSWAAVSSIISNDRLLIIVLDGFMMHIIPRRAFQSMEAAGNFILAAERLKNLASQPNDAAA
jgi:hypothetical protein